MKGFRTRKPVYTGDIPAPQQAGAHQERVLQALWPESRTRRGFLIGVGGSLPLVGGLARAATNFSSIEDQHGVSVSVSGLPVWRIDTRWFEGDPRLKVRHSINALHIDLRQARFPGTNIDADFTLKAVRRGAQWQAQFHFGSLGFSSSVNFAHWLLGTEPALGEMRMNGARLSVGGTVALGQLAGQVRFRPDWSFHLERVVAGSLELAGKIIGLDALRLELDAPVDYDAPHSPATRAWAHLASGADLVFELHGASLELGPGPALAFLHSQRDQASMLVQPGDAGGKHGGGRMCWHGETPLRLPVDAACGRFELVGNRMTASARALWKSSYWHVDQNLAARFSTASMAAAITSTPPDQAASGMRPAAPVADHFVIDLPGVDAAIFQLRTIGGIAPASGAGFADVRDFARNGVPLRAYDLRLRRASDGLFCTVRFSGLKLQRRNNSWRLVQIDIANEALIEFDLGSQHLMEEALLLGDWPERDPAAYEWPRPKEAPEEGPAPVVKKLLGLAPMRFEAARPSHLTFALKRKGDLAKLPLTIDALFSWTDDGVQARPDARTWLEPVLSPRAMPAGALAQRDPATGKEATQLDDLVIARPRSLGEHPTPNALFGTAIEAPARLVISPVPPSLAASGHAAVPWKSPPAGPLAAKAVRSELWHARLHDAKIRAIYSADANGTGPADRSTITVDVFNPPFPFKADRDPFRASLDSRDRHELVALTALYGFPTVCPVTPKSSCTSLDGKTPTPGNYVPVPINAELLLLSSQGASFRYRGRWDPPAEKTGKEGALSVQRYIHFSQLGRDIFCQVEYKGFLFPLGHPAILIKQTERKFYLKNGKQFVAGLMQRFFIHVPAFNRQFPAVDQGLEGRLWGHANTTMDDVITPSLDDPDKSKVNALPGQSAFWPRLPLRDGVGPTDVLFEFYEPGTDARYLAPLVWIDNNVAHNSALLRTLIDTWRAGVSSALALPAASWPSATARFFARVRSARLPYVPGVYGDNTNIETTDILLGVHVKEDAGYDDRSACNAELRTTPRMEGQNQPPFYPTRRRAKIISSLLATLTGKRSEAHLLQFDPVYAEIGMGSGNKSTIFAVFAERGALMDFGGDTAKSGGFANPSALMVKFTAERGPAGGSEKDIIPLSSLVPACLVAPRPRTLTEEKPAPTTSDDFNPREYFAAVLGDAKLLGVVRLVDILETLMAATGTSFPTIKRESLFELPLAALRDMLEPIDAKLADFDTWFAEPGKQSPPIPPAVAARLQPSWNRLRAAISAGIKLIKQPKPNELAVIAAAAAIAAAAQTLVADTRALTADPVLLLPEAARTLVEKATGLINLLRSMLPPQNLLVAFKPLLDALIEERVVHLIDELSAAIVNAPAYGAALRALAQLKVLINEFRLAAGNAMVLVEKLRENLLQRLHDAAIEAILQLAMAGQELVFGPNTLLGRLAPLLAAQVTAQTGRYKLLLNEGAAQVTQPVLDLHAMLDDCARQVKPADGPDQARVAEVLVRLRQDVSAISDAINAHVDRMQRIADDAAHLQQWFPPAGAGPATAAGARTPLAQLVPLLGDVLEQTFDGINLGMLTVTRLADMLVELGSLKANLTGAQVKSAEKIMREAGARIGSLVPVAQLDELSTRLGALAGQDPLDAMTQYWPLFGTAAQAVTQLRSMLFDQGGLLSTVPDAIWTTAGAEIHKQLQQKYASQFKLLADLDRMRSTLVKAVRAFSPAGLDARVRAEVNARIRALQKVLTDIVRKKIDQVGNAAAALFCENGGAKLLNFLGELRAYPSPYLSDQAIAALDRAIKALTTCTTSSPGAIGEIFDSLSALMALLGRSLASGDVSQLVSVEKLLDEIIAQFGIPTRIRIDYDWNTQVESFPKGDDAIFEPLNERRLVIKAVIEASLRGEAPSASIQATLSPYAVHLFGKVGAANFLSIYFDGLVLNATPDKGIKCDTKVTRVEPGVALGFVKKLSELFAPNSGFYMFPTFSGIEVGYRFGSEYELLAGLVIQNISFTIAATLPFDNSPMRMRLQLSDKEKPFLISAGIYGGGGFLAISTRADTLELLEASFEYGAMVAFAYGPAKGSGRVTAGIYIRMGGRDPVIEGFFCAQGEVRIANLITVSASLRVTLAYRIKTGQTSGSAVYSFKFSIGFVDFRYSARVDYAKDGDQGPEKTESNKALLSATSGTLAPLRERNARKFDKPKAVDETIRAGLLAPDTWRRYWRAYRKPNPDRPARIESVSRTPREPYRRNDRRVENAVETMRAKLAAAPQADQALKVLEWYCVPWGTGDAGKLRLSLRAMPAFCAGECPAAKAALADWPAFMAAVGQVTLTVNGQSTTVDLGALYVARLNELGLSLRAMSLLWKNLFPETLERPSVPLASLRTSGQAGRFKMHDSADLAATTASRVGQLFAESLGGLKPERIKALAANGFLPQSGLSDDAGTLLGEIARIYAPVTSRQRAVADPAKARIMPATTGAVVKKWHDKILHVDSRPQIVIGKDGKDTLAEAFATPYSAAALAFLDDFIARDGRVGLASALRGIQDPMARLLLRHRVAYTSDLPSETAWPTETLHDRLAGLTTNPWLLKVLGLVIDLEADLPPAPANSQPSVMLSRWSMGKVTNIEPQFRMRTIMTQDGFPKVKDGDQKYAGSRSGCMDLSSAGRNAYVLNQVDIDRTPERLLQLALSYRAEIMAGKRVSEASSGMQGQETVGLSLISKYPETIPPDVGAPVEGAVNDVYVHHLAIGYRPDVQRMVGNEDPAGARVGPWTSLMARKLRRVHVRGKDITHLLSGIEVDEGILMERTRTVKDDQATLSSATAELIEGELFRWGNWVLGAPHPDSEGAPLHTAPAEHQPAPTTRTDAKIKVEYGAAEGASAQRFGSGYRVGMRIVMIDGNSVPLDEAARAHYPDVKNGLSLGDETSANDYGFAPFLRYEPVAPPTPLLIAPLQRERFPTESARKLLVASGAGGPTRAMTQRVLVAPRCASIDLAIRHGMFDAAGRQEAPPASAFHGVKLTRTGDFPTDRKGSGEHATSDLYYKVQSGAAVPLIPYYPDPWAQRMIIGFYRAADDCLLAFDFFDYYDATHRWPNCRSLQLDLVAVDRVDNAALGFDWMLTDARLTVRIAPGVRLNVRTWHEMDVEKLNQSAVVDQLVVACRSGQCGAQLRDNLNLGKDAGDADVREQIVAVLSQWHTRRNFGQQTARPSGRASTIANLTSFWMLNPPVQLELLHAVAKPMRPPELSDASGDAPAAPRVLQLPAHASGIEQPFRIVRAAAQTSATFSGHIRLHRPSTRSVEAQAKWTDNASRAVREPRSGRYAVLAEKRQGLLFNIAELAEVATDDKGRPPDKPMMPELDARQHLQLLEATVPVGPARPLESRPVSGSYDFGDTRARVLDVELLGRARHALDFGGAGKDAHLVRSPRQRVIAQGTERPSAPKVEYVIPLYNWSNGEEPYGRIRRTREAGWFRIWLDKDWYSVGNGELLAIVCWPDMLLAPAARRFLLSRTRSTPSQFATPPAAIEPLVTRWGLDPLADQKVDMGNMPASALKNRLRNLGQLRASAARNDATVEADVYHLQDMPSFEPMVSIDPAMADARVALALYRPLCDEASGRWFADIQIDPQYAYCPFVRLGLARYQAHALEPLRMSPIVATEFIQLLPERTTTIVPGKKDNSRQRQFEVFLAGATLSAASSAGASRSELSIRVENRHPGKGGWFALPTTSREPVGDPWAGEEMKYVASDNVWSAKLEIEHVPGMAYSLVIEEYEHLSDSKVGESRKLVFFDRIALPERT